MENKVRPALLLIFDGWGLSDNADHNAIHAAKTPVWDRLWAAYPHTVIRTSGSAVGLPGGQMGNSEVGQNALGAGQSSNTIVLPAAALEAFGDAFKLLRGRG